MNARIAQDRSLVVAVTAALLLTAQPSPGAAAQRTLRSPFAAASDPILTKIQADVASYALKYKTPGIAVDFLYHGTPYTVYYGVQDLATKVPISAATAFELGSVTKTFTALDLGIAVLAPSTIKVLDPKTTITVVPVNTPADEFLALYPQPKPSTVEANGAPCPSTPHPAPLSPASYSTTFKTSTLKDYADHSSTLPDTPPSPFAGMPLSLNLRPCYPSQVLVNYAESYVSPSGTKVGATYLYSDIGFGILGDALEGIYQTDYYTLTQKLVLAPLAMNNTVDVAHAAAQYGSHYATPYTAANAATLRWPLNAWPGGGTLRSTAPDMLLYLKAALWQSPNATVNDAMAYDQLQTTDILAGPGVTQGLAWTWTTVSGGRKIYSKDGATAGFSSWIGVSAQRTASSTGVVVLANQSSAVAPKLGEQILTDVGP